MLSRRRARRLALGPPRNTPAATTLLRQADYTEPQIVSAARIAGQTKLKAFKASQFVDFVHAALEFHHVERGETAHPDAEEYQDWLSSNPIEQLPKMSDDIANIPVLADMTWNYKGRTRRGFEHLGKLAQDFYFCNVPKEVNTVIEWNSRHRDIVYNALYDIQNHMENGTMFRQGSPEFRQLRALYNYLISPQAAKYLDNRHRVLTAHGHPKFKDTKKITEVVEEALREHGTAYGWHAHTKHSPV